MANRMNYAPAFKAKVALAALSGSKTVAELSTEYGVHQTLINTWARQLKDGAAEVRGKCEKILTLPPRFLRQIFLKKFLTNIQFFLLYF